jgi:hypothetical protein
MRQVSAIYKDNNGDDKNKKKRADIFHKKRVGVLARPENLPI